MNGTCAFTHRIEFLLLLVVCILSACSPTDSPLVVDDEAIANEEEIENWLAYGRTHNEQRFSPITDINTTNVGDLKVDWYIDLPNDVGLVSTPLVVDGVLYFVGSRNIVKAVDATSGALIWEYDPREAEYIGSTRRAGFSHSRGITFYKGKVFLATWSGRLIAVDAKTGKEIWTAVTFGLDEPLFITGAPKAFKDKVLIGNGGAETGPSRGYVTAYDTETGELAWRFYIVPGNPVDGFENEAMEMAAETWTGEWWKHGGGGNAWHGFTYDAELDVLYIGTGNGSPWNRKVRSPEGGDNLFLCSIVALDPDTGEYLWHYQTTPGETWDYNSNMDIVLADLEIEGEEVKAILHAPKNGFFYVINRATGKLISAEPFVETSWASHVDLATGKPVELPGVRFEEGPAYITPPPFGAHNWHAMSYNPLTGLTYIPTLHKATIFADAAVDLTTWQSIPFQGGSATDGFAPEKQPREYPSSLLAWDPVKQSVAWSVPQDHYWNAGTLTTAGNLVFQGRADGHLLAYDARNGESLWDFDAGLGISAPPITYKLNGRQYIALLVGWGGGYPAWNGDMGWAYKAHTRRLIAFSLDGEVELPKLPPPYFPVPIKDDTFIVEDALAYEGAVLFDPCSWCHGGGVAAPDLTASMIPLDHESFVSVVREGSRAGLGMPAYQYLTDDQLLALRHFIRRQAMNAITATSPEGG